MLFRTNKMSVTYWFIIKNNEVLLLEKNRLPNNHEIQAITPYFIRQFQLIQDNHTNYYCAEMDSNHDTPDDLLSMPLRQTLSILDKTLFGLCAKAYSIIHWDKNHQYCSRCGALTQHRGPHFERICPSCSLSFFPRISPSIIVLIKRDDHVLMARSPHFAPNVYSLIAGFVEAGENLEETIHREVYEEVGLTVKNISYFGSQSWPFPDSLMIGFTADYASGDILIDQNEIEAAGWYKYNNLPGLPPTTISISSALLNDFINTCEKKYSNKAIALKTTNPLT